MENYCGANCENCGIKENCHGCTATCGSPFGGRCVAAEYIKVGGRKGFEDFKAKLLEEINELLKAEGLGKAEELCELAGSFINLEYTMPSGEKVKLLNDKNIYLGTQIEFAEMGVCYGVAADASFILISSYSVDGSEPEIVLYKRR